MDIKKTNLFLLEKQLSEPVKKPVLYEKYVNERYPKSQKGQLYEKLKDFGEKIYKPMQEK